MFIPMQYQTHHQIVQQLEAILILIVSRRSTVLTIKKRILQYLDTGHGPITATIYNRHVGDLGNIVTNANGTVTISISDSIIQFYNSTQSIMNRTIVVHYGTDDGGGVGDSNVTG